MHRFLSSFDLFQLLPTSFAAATRDHHRRARLVAREQALLAGARCLRERGELRGVKRVALLLELGVEEIGASAVQRLRCAATDVLAPSSDAPPRCIAQTRVTIDRLYLTYNQYS